MVTPRGVHGLSKNQTDEENRFLFGFTFLKTDNIWFDFVQKNRTDKFYIYIYILFFINNCIHQILFNK